MNGSGRKKFFFFLVAAYESGNGLLTPSWNGGVPEQIDGFISFSRDVFGRRNGPEDERWPTRSSKHF